VEINTLFSQSAFSVDTFCGGRLGVTVEKTGSSINSLLWEELKKVLSMARFECDVEFVDKS